MVRTDYHTHTPLCLHAEGEPEDYVSQALHLGLHSYGISDHAPMPPEKGRFDDWRMEAGDLSRYVEWMDRARTAAAHRCQVLSALECDWLPGIAPWILELRSFYPWDYLIGSVHYLGSLGSVDDSLYAHQTISGSVEKDWELYWEAMTAMIQSGLFDIVGHMDLVKIWGRVPSGDLSRFYSPALDALEGSGMAVEINTAGWHKMCHEQYPSVPLLKELLLRKIPLVINSDAHRPEHLSRDWEQALSLLQEWAPHRLQQYSLPLKHSSTSLFVYGSL